jgi:cytochrome c peroxidase
MMKQSKLFRPTLLTAAIAAVVVGISVPAGNSAVAADAAPPPLAPLGEIPIPPDNLQTPEKIELGKILFFDPRLGGDASTGCSTCHEPDQGWAWAEDLSRGYPGTVHWRNSQTIINSGYYARNFWAGSVPSLEKQAPSAAKGGVAGNGENDIMEARLALIPDYVERFRTVWGTDWPLIDDAWKSIAAFERTLVQRDTPLDKFLGGDKGALSDQQQRGMALYNGKAGCIQCHNGALASDQDYHNVGVPPSKRWEEDGLAQITFRFENYAKGQTEKNYRTAKSDWGFYFRGKNAWDKGKFRTPSLRYIAYTAPYMHNGAFYTL